MLLNVELLEESLRGDGFWALDGAALDAVPDESGEDAELTADAEENGVEVLLLHAVVLEEDARVGIDVGEGVLGLSVLGEDVGHDLVDGIDEDEELIIGEVTSAEVTLAVVAGIGLAENGVAVSGDDTLAVEEVPGELVKGLLESGLVLHVDASLLALALHLEEESENLLVGKTVEGSGEAVESSAEGEVGIRESGADQGGGVGGHVPVLCVDTCLLYTSPSPRDRTRSRMPSSA
eukprot:TRINITY_DN3854_c0_g1_i2.p1 TRINITY_DN3854_c0_g1~~TRINITY_DN3854_c0_g1_i2.p1  ORF type:complete len:235 (-),score=80.32 TRINITY_DN3854_c0_g1_i2:83-787(-)